MTTVGGMEALRRAASIRGTTEERAVASLLTPGGTRAAKGDFVGIHDFEVVTWLVVLPEADPARSTNPLA